MGVLAFYSIFFYLIKISFKQIKRWNKYIFESCFLVQGEVCSNGTRVFVQRGIYDQFLAEFVRQALKMMIGDPLNSDTTVGATISKEHADKVLGYVAGAVKEGATVACGG